MFRIALKGIIFICLCFCIGGNLAFADGNCVSVWDCQNSGACGTGAGWHYGGHG